jgi:glutaredoxin
MRMIRKCVEDEECKVTLYKIDGCEGCEMMEEKLDELGIPYTEKDVTANVCKRTGLDSVPQVVIETPEVTYVIQSRKKLEELLG